MAVMARETVLRQPKETVVANVSEKPMRSYDGQVFKCREQSQQGEGVCNSTYTSREVMVKHLRRVHRKSEGAAAELAASYVV